MVQDKELAKAVAGIPQRSEKQGDTQKLVEAFVDPGILPQVDSINSQIIYGRRGTGKTHVLRVFESSLKGRNRTCVVYIDARTFGSTEQFTDVNVALPSRCTSLFRDLLGEVYNGLLNFVVQQEGPDVDRALEEVNRLGVAAVEPVEATRKESSAEKKSSQVSSRSGIDLKISPVGPTLGGSLADEQTQAAEASATYRFEYSDKVIFPSVSGPLKTILGIYGAQLYVLLDEWSSLPLDVQPYLAEFIKRSFLPVPDVAVKIASLEYRSNFGVTTPSSPWCNGPDLGMAVGVG
jgi:hypothetical protein